MTGGMVLRKGTMRNSGRKARPEYAGLSFRQKGNPTVSGSRPMALTVAGVEVWSLFTGAGGLDLGLARAGFHPSLAVEIDPSCCTTLRRHFPGLDVWETDIREVTAASLAERRHHAEVFLMVGGPPCQSFCPGGKRAALSDPRGNLIYTYLRLVDEIRPHVFVLENVAHLVTAALRHRPIAQRPGKRWNLSVYHEDRTNGDASAPPMEPDELSGSAIRQVFGEMEALGYAVNFGIVDAADYGAAQHRFRFVMLGVREGVPPPMPPATHGPFASSGESWRTLRDAIFGLRDNPGPHSEYTADVARYFALVPPGGNWRQLPKELQPKALGDAAYAAGGGKTGFFRRLSWDAPSPTITGRSNRKGSAVCHPDFVRPLSVRECARLQGFPDDWVFEGSMSDQYMQIGNAVPVHLGEAIGRVILELTAPRQRRAAAHTPEVERLLDAAIARLRATAKNKRKRSDGQLLLLDDLSPGLET